MKVTRKLFVSMLAVVFAIVALGASTYAWFTLTNVNTVGDVNISITTGESLDISLDGISYTTKLTSEMIQEKIGNNLTLRPVTSTDGKVFKRISSVSGDTVSYTTLTTSENVDYICIPIWFRATTVPASMTNPSIFLTDLLKDTYDADTPVSYTTNTAASTWLVSEGVTFKSATTYTDESGATITNATPASTKYAANASRVAFVQGTLADNTKGDSVIFDFSNTAATAKYGIMNGQSSYYSAQNPTTPITDNILTALNHDSPQTVVTELTDTFTQGIAADNDSKICELTSTTVDGEIVYVGKTYLVVWLEGWDADCYEAIAKDTILCQLNFELAGKHVTE